MTDREAPTWAQVRELETRAAQLASELEETREESRRMAIQAREAVRAGADADSLIDLQARLAARVATLEGALGDLGQEIEEKRQAVIRSDAERRLAKGLPRAGGSLQHELKIDAARIEQLTEELERVRKQKRTHTQRLDELQFEARLLSLRFGLPESPAAAGFNAPLLLDGPFRIEVLDEERVRVVADGGRGKRTVTGESGRILAAAGPWERTQEEVEGERQAKEKAREAELQAARDRVDDWLRDLLATGPVARERVLKLAEEEGLPLHRTNNTRGSSVAEARQRLDLVPLETRDGSRTPFWSLPGLAFDQEQFEVYSQDDRRSREMSAAMR